MLKHVTLPRIGAIETILKELSPSSAVAVDNGTMCCDSNVVLSCKLLMSSTSFLMCYEHGNFISYNFAHFGRSNDDSIK